MLAPAWKGPPMRRTARTTLVALAAAGALLVPAGGASAAPPPVRDLSAACDDAPAPEPSFTDIRRLPEATQVAINCLTVYRITEGYADGTYRPHDTVQRYQMALFVHRTLAYVSDNNQLVDMPVAEDAGFADLEELSEEAKVAINTLAAAGIVTGRTATEFAPGARVTRRDMASFVNRLQDYFAAELADPEAAYVGVDGTFTDVPADLERADDVNALAAHGIVQGTADGTFEPYGQVTRAEMAFFLMRQMDDNVADGRIDQCGGFVPAGWRCSPA
jgi:hypothetical protein